MKRSWVALCILLLAGLGAVRADQTTAAVQKALKEQGFYYGDITGGKSAETTAALRRYQIRNGLQITGEIDAETLRSLGVGSSAARLASRSPQPLAPAEEPESEDDAPTQSAEITPPPSYRAPAYGYGSGYGASPAVPQPRMGNGVFAGTPYEMAPPDLQRHVVVGAQRLLARYGLYRSGIDGEFGPGTGAAVRAFQLHSGLVVDGRLNMATLGALGLLPGQRGPGYPVPRRVYPGRPVYRGQWVP